MAVTIMSAITKRAKPDMAIFVLYLRLPRFARSDMVNVSNKFKIP